MSEDPSKPTTYQSLVALLSILVAALLIGGIAGPVMGLSTNSVDNAARPSAPELGQSRMAVALTEALMSSNTSPAFDNGDSTTITVNEDSSGNNITSVLAVTDSDNDDTLTWSQSNAPNNGGSTSGFNDSQSAGPNVTPTGLTYTPGSDISGTTAESFEVQVSDGTDTDTITVNVDVQDAPEVSAITRKVPASQDTNANDVTYDVTFSESVNGVETSDFTATTVSGSPSGSISSVGNAGDGDGSTYVVNVDVDDSGDGELRLDLVDDDSITNVNGVPLGGNGTSSNGDGSYSSGESYVIDNTPPSFPSKNVNIAEETTGNVIDIEAGDDGANNPDTNVDYALAGTDASNFSINNGTGQISLDSPLDHENPTDNNTDNIYQLIVGASDDSGNLYLDFVNVNITEVNEAPSQPSDSNGTSNEVAEAASNGDSVGITASSTDVDDPDGSLSYTLSADASGRFQINSSTGEVTVANMGKLDYESSTRHNITVRASDGLLSESSNFTINITDSEEMPVFTSGASASVAEDATNGRTVHDVNANVGGSDDKGVSYQFTSGNSAGAFIINSNSGQVNVADDSQFDYEGTNNFSLTVKASEGSATQTQNITISVTDVNETPTFASVGSQTVAESDSAGTSVVDIDANVNANGATATDTGVSYNLAGGNDDVANDGGGAFAINGSSGQITINDADDIDESAQSSFTLTVEASEGSQSNTQSVTINVNDDVSPTFKPGSSTPTDGSTSAPPSGDVTLAFDETVTLGTGNIKIVDDGDDSSTETLDVTSGSVSATGNAVTVTPSSNLEADTNYHIEINGTAIDDNYGNSYAGFTDSTTYDFKTADTTPSFTSGGSTSVTVDEDGSLNLTGELEVKDTSLSDTLTWTVTVTPSHGSLSGIDASESISGSNTPHTLSTSPTYTPNADYSGSDSFTVQVGDNNPDTTDSISVSVTVDDAPEVSSITRSSPSTPTNADSVDFDVSFNESVSNVGASDFTLSTTNSVTTANGDSDISVAGSGSSYTVTVTNVQGDGTLGIDLVDDDTITSDSTGVSLGGDGTSSNANGSYTSGETFTIDNTAPTLTDDTGMTDEDTSGTIEADLLSNDHDAHSLTVTKVEGSASNRGNPTTGSNSGKFTIDSAGQVDFDPNGAFESLTGSGSDTTQVTVTVKDAVGNTNTQTVTATVNGVNDAPTMSSDTRSLTNIDEDATSNGGTTVATVLGSAGTTSDAEGMNLGVAVTGVDDTDGHWEYSTDAGSSWQDVSSASPAAGSALLLADDDHIRFVPTADFNGNAGGSVTVRAWDQTSDTAGDTSADTTTSGTTAYASTTASTNITVNAVNDAPSISIGSDQTANGVTSQQTVSNFATGFSPGGGSDESGQSINDFIITETSDSDSVLSSVDVANDGNLSYTASDGVEGTATVELQVKDDGGTTNGGNDTSTAKSFDITVDTQAPTVSSARVKDTTLTVTMDEALSAASSNTPPNGDLTVTAGGSTISVTDINISGSEITLTLANKPSAGSDVTLDYTQSSNVPEDTATNQLASFSGQTVTNNVESTGGGGGGGGSVGSGGSGSSLTADTADPTADAGSDRLTTAGAEITFDGSASAGNGGIDSYEWDFGDGTTASGAQTAHTYTDTGTYTVELTVTDDDSNDDTDSVTVTVSSATPTSSGNEADADGNETADSDYSASASASGYVTEVWSSLTLDASTSTLPEDSSPTYKWDIGGDSTVDYTGQTVSHQFTQTGQRTISLAVQADNQIWTDSLTIEVVDSVQPTAVGPSVSVTPRTGNFEGVGVGETGYREFSVTNLASSRTNLSVDETLLTGGDPEPFNIVSGTAPFDIAPGETRTVNVSYSPTDASESNAQLQLHSDASNLPQISIWLSSADTYFLIQEGASREANDNPSDTTTDNAADDQMSTVSVQGQNVKSGSELSVNISQPETRTQHAEFSVLNMTVRNQGSFDINVTHANSPVSNESATYEPANRTVIQYVELEHSVNSSTTYDDIGVTFRLQRSAVPDGVPPETVTLSRYSNGDWHDMSAELVGESDTHYRYSAETPGFAQFAVSVPTASAVANDRTLDSQANGPEGTNTEKAETVFLNRSGGLLFAVVALVGVAVVLFLGLYRRVKL